jgi:hypothetical protein
VLCVFRVLLSHAPALKLPSQDCKRTNAQDPA